MSKKIQPSTYINVNIAEDGHILVALQMQRLFTPTLTSRISHRICRNYASGPGRPGGAVAPFAPY